MEIKLKTGKGQVPEAANTIATGTNQEFKDFTFNFGGPRQPQPKAEAPRQAGNELLTAIAARDGAASAERLSTLGIDAQTISALATNQGARVGLKLRAA